MKVLELSGEGKELAGLNTAVLEGEKKNLVTLRYIRLPKRKTKSRTRRKKRY